MAAQEYNALRERLTDRKKLLRKAVSDATAQANLVSLLQKVDQALEKMNTGNYGLCEVCHGNIEPERLLADPLIEVCLDHLNQSEKKMLEYDLEISTKVQRALLPKNDLELIKNGISTILKRTALPMGLFCGGEFKTEKTKFNSGDCLIIYSDGLLEAFYKEEQYGEERITEIAEKYYTLPTKELINIYLSDLASFKKDYPQNDDLTIMVVKKI